MSLLKNNENRSVVIFTLAAFDWWSFLHSRERRSGHFRARATISNFSFKKSNIIY